MIEFGQPWAAALLPLPLLLRLLWRSAPPLGAALYFPRALASVAEIDVRGGRGGAEEEGKASAAVMKNLASRVGTMGWRPRHWIEGTLRSRTGARSGRGLDPVSDRAEAEPHHDEDAHHHGVHE